MSKNNESPAPTGEQSPGLSVPSGSTVPFSEAQIERTKETFYDGRFIPLSGERKVEVYTVKDRPGDLCIRIFRPTNDGKISRLEFGLSEEDAFALLALLKDHLSNDAMSHERSELAP